MGEHKADWPLDTKAAIAVVKNALESRDQRIAALEAERDNAMSEALNSAALMLKEARREGARDALTCSNCNYMAKPPICTKCGCAIGEVDDEV